jgi:hypothetical protein
MSFFVSNSICARSSSVKIRPATSFGNGAGSGPTLTRSVRVGVMSSTVTLTRPVSVVVVPVPRASSMRTEIRSATAGSVPTNVIRQLRRSGRHAVAPVVGPTVTDPDA